MVPSGPGGRAGRRQGRARAGERGAGRPRVPACTAPAAMRQPRSSRRRILPTGVFGRSLRNSTSLGLL